MLDSKRPQSPPTSKTSPVVDAICEEPIHAATKRIARRIGNIESTSALAAALGDNFRHAHAMKSDRSTNANGVDEYVERPEAGVWHHCEALEL